MFDGLSVVVRWCDEGRNNVIYLMTVGRAVEVFYYNIYVIIHIECQCMNVRGDKEGVDGDREEEDGCTNNLCTISYVA